MIAFRNGLITYNGSGNSGDPGKPLQLPPGKVPTAVAMTNSAEFALITVWDVNALKGQVAVIAMKTINWMQPTNGFFSDMKLLGFIDLPKDLRCPSGICAGSDSPFGKEIENADIHDEGKRAKLAEDPNCAATRGFAVVISRAREPRLLHRPRAALPVGARQPPGPGQALRRDREAGPRREGVALHLRRRAAREAARW